MSKLECQCEMIEISPPCECWENSEFVEERIHQVIGGLAYSINKEFRDEYILKGALLSIISIARSHHKDGKMLVKWINLNWEKIFRNGKIMKKWPGPYGNYDITCQDEIYFRDYSLQYYREYCE